MQKYLVHTRHDKGEITIHVVASSEDAAIHMVMEAERCPRRSILWVKTEAQIEEEHMNNIITINDFVGREVICNVSCLVSDVYKLASQASYEDLRGTSFDMDELQDLMSRPDYESAADSHIQGMDRDDLISALDEANVEDERNQTTIAEAAAKAILNLVTSGDFDPHTDGSIEDGCSDQMDQWPGLDDDDLRDKLRDALKAEDDGHKDFALAHDLDYDYHEVYEHWAVTDWFARKLREKGEIVGDLANLTVWGRCTTGQAISMDWVIQSIYNDLMEAK